jgi:hypothetical protein
VTGERSGLKAAWLGACWGLGHTLTLLTAGAALVFLRTEMPARASDAFEFLSRSCWWASGCARSIRRRARGPTVRPIHITTAASFTHPGVPAHMHIGRWIAARRPLLIGAVHGRRQRRAHCPCWPRCRQRRAAHLHGAVWPGLDGRHGGALRHARVAPGTTGEASNPRPRIRWPSVASRRRWVWWGFPLGRPAVLNPCRTRAHRGRRPRYR